MVSLNYLGGNFNRNVSYIKKASKIKFLYMPCLVSKATTNIRLPIERQLKTV